MTITFARPLIISLLVCAAGVGPAIVTPVLAQTAPAQETTEQRLKRMEAEMRAMQRRVFPDGAGKVFGPEITPTAPSTPAGDASATTPMADVMVRMDAVEAQLQRLTAQTEESQNRMSKLEARLAVLESRSAPDATSGSPAVILPGAKPAAESAVNPAPVARPAATAPRPVADAKPATAKPSADRVAAVQALEKPVSGDKGEDEYLYGYRLYDAKFYPEAQQQLTRVVEQFPKHKRISYARNLLGRAYLEDGKPGTAAQWFLQNYLGDKKGDRAPDSLLYLGVAMTRIKDSKRACGAFAELKDTYPTEVIGRLKTQYDNAIKGVKCD